MGDRRRSIGLHPTAQTQRAREAFREWRPDEEGQRAAQIAALPVVEWRGRTLYTLRCQGTTGRGPHDVHVPESQLWALIDFRAFRCPFHHDAPCASQDEP